MAQRPASPGNERLNNAPDDEDFIPLRVTKPIIIERNISPKHLDTQKTLCSECFAEYSQHTSIHGIQYLGEDSRPTWERIFWMVVLIVSVSICTKMIYNLWIKWEETPVIVSFNERETEIWKIPFPSVTICPEDKYDPEKFDYELAINTTNDSSLNLDRQTLSMVCPLIADVIEGETKLRFEGPVPENFDLNVKLNHFHPNPFSSSIWQDEGIQMEKILTDEGICFNFNMLALSDIYSDECILPRITQEEAARQAPSKSWNRETGFERDDLEVYPHRNLGAGLKLGLKIQIVTTIKSRHCSFTPGFKVLIHSPDNLPRLSTKHFRVPHSQDVVAAIKPNMIITSETLRSYSPERRLCYFNGEKKLKYFKVYTQNNCDVECLTDYILRECNCVKFSMPRFNGTNICFTSSEVDCYEEAEKTYLTSRFKQSENNNWDCHCLPPCISVDYNVETSQADFNVQALDKSFSDMPEELEMQVSQISIFFKDSTFLTSKRSELYGFSEFIANCGGLLGLFMGVSALSFIEIFYFSVMRTFSNNMDRRRRRFTTAKHT